MHSSASPRPPPPVPLPHEGLLGPSGEPPLPPGTRIGGDVVEAVLGSGCFGTVYQVRGPEGYRAALKLLPLERGEERARRARRELSLGTRLHHPNLARLVGAGQWPEDTPRYLWLKFELVRGPTLEQWADQPGRTVGEVVERVLEVARGLAVAHDARVVHRDVKEDNILVRERDGQAVLVDFGAGYHEGDATLTHSMFPPGAPLYRAPEAWAHARAHRGVARAHYRARPGDDLYALGVVFYRLLTHRFPFDLTDDGGVDVEAVLHRAPLPPHIVNSRVPRAVEAVCLRLLEKQPQARYPGAVALCEALEALRSREDVDWTAPLHEHRPPPAVPRRWARRARVLAAMGGGLALALGAWWLSSGQEVAPPEPPPESARAVAPPPPEVHPPAAAAPPAAPRKDSAPVKQHPQTSGAQAPARPKDRGAILRNACLGLTGAALQACLGAQQQVPPVRPTPPPQACPFGAVETMTGTLGLHLGETKTVIWPETDYTIVKPVRVDEDTPLVVSGHWKAGADLNPGGRGEKVALPNETRLFGRLYFGEGRVYGRFTEARTPTGVTYPVCLELWEQYGKVPGLPMKSGSEEGKVLVDRFVEVRVVDRFK